MQEQGLLGKGGPPCDPKAVQCMSAAFSPAWQRTVGHGMEATRREWPRRWMGCHSLMGPGLGPPWLKARATPEPQASRGDAVAGG